MVLFNIFLFFSKNTVTAKSTQCFLATISSRTWSRMSLIIQTTWNIDMSPGRLVRTCFKVSVTCIGNTHKWHHVTEGSDFVWGMFYGYKTRMIFVHKKHKRRSQFHKLLQSKFHSTLSIEFYQIGMLHHSLATAWELHFRFSPTPTLQRPIKNPTNVSDNWISLNVQQNFNGRNQHIQIFNKSNYKVGRNLLVNRFQSLNNN